MWGNDYYLRRISRDMQVSVAVTDRTKTLSLTARTYFSHLLLGLGGRQGRLLYVVLTAGPARWNVRLEQELPPERGARLREKARSVSEAFRLGVKHVLECVTRPRLSCAGWGCGWEAGEAGAGGTLFR